MRPNKGNFAKALLFCLIFFIWFSTPIYALSEGTEIASFVSDTLQIITLVASLGAVFFLIKGGYVYITSTGNPGALEHAKKTIRNAVVGLILILCAGTLGSLLNNSIEETTTASPISSIEMSPIESLTENNGLVQALLDAVTGLLKILLESSVTPLVDAVMGFLTTTPSLMQNSVVFKFWTVMLGIADALFVLVIALLGLQFMSASTFGFEEVELKQLLPRIGLAFLGANTSLFLADYIILANNALIKTVLDATGGFDTAWFVNATDPGAIFSVVGTPLITLLFLLIFLILAVVLLIFYVSRLIVISLGSVLAPFIFLLWATPKFADFAEITVKAYIATVFTVFVHVVTIQLATSYLILPENSNNSLLSIAIAIGLFATLLKTPSVMVNLIVVSTGSNMLKKATSHIVNVLTTDKSEDKAKKAIVINQIVQPKSRNYKPRRRVYA